MSASEAQQNHNKAYLNSRNGNKSPEIKETEERLQELASELFGSDKTKS